MNAPDGWRVRRLGDLVHPARKITYGIVQPGPRQEEGVGVPLIRGQDYSSGSVATDGLYWVRPDIAAAYRRSTVTAGDLLLSIVGYVGLTAEVPVSLSGANITQTTARIAVREGVNSHYVLHYLRGCQFQTEVRRFQKGSAQPGLNLGDVEVMRCMLPADCNEQHAIAAVLDTVDDTIWQTEQLISKLRQVKKGLLHDLLTRGVDDNGELRDPERHPEQFRESQLGRIPASWTASPVADQFDIQSGITLGPHRVPRANPRPYLRVANVHRARLDLSDIAHLEARDSELVSKQLAIHDLLIVEGHADPREIGRCAMVTPSAAGFTFQNHLFRLRPISMLPTFALLQLNSLWTQRYWTRTCTSSSGLRTINRSQLARLPIAVPPKDEQERICAAADALEQRLSEEDRAAEAWRRVKAGLGGDLLTGRVRTTPLTGTSA